MSFSKEVKQEFYDNSFTLVGRIFHPNLLSTKTKKGRNGGADREIYDVMFAWLQNDSRNVAELDRLNKFMMAKIPVLYPGTDPRALYNPVKKFETYQRKDFQPNPEYLRGCAWMNIESGIDYPPAVVTASRQPVMSEAEIWSGRNAIVNFTFYPQEPKAGADGTKGGFGVNLKAVMLMEGGAKEGGVPTVDVDKIFGGFAADMGIGQQQQNQQYNPNQQQQQGQYNPYAQNNPQQQQGQYNPNQQQQQQGQYNPNQNYNPNANGGNAGGGFI